MEAKDGDRQLLGSCKRQQRGWAALEQQHWEPEGLQGTGMLLQQGNLTGTARRCAGTRNVGFQPRVTSGDQQHPDSITSFCWALAQAAQWGGGVTNSGGAQEMWKCGQWVTSMVGGWLDWIPLKVFSNPYGSTSPTSPSQHRVQDGQRKSHIPLLQPLLCEEGFLAHPLLSSSCPTCLARQL